MRRNGEDITPDIRHIRSCPDKHLEKKTYSKKCEYCDKIIVMNMKRHILDVHVNKNIKPFKCTMCSFCSHAKRYLLWHIRRHHNPNNPPGGDSKGNVNGSFNNYVNKHTVSVQIERHS